VKNSYKGLVANIKGRIHLRDTGINEKIILKDWKIKIYNIHY
jgi:hypothetical protein